MSPLGYCAPGILGVLVGLVYAAFGGGDRATVERVILGGYLVPLLFLAGQLLMVAAQGLFAGVLPVPFGKSLRGAKCGVIGVLILVGMTAGVLAYLLSRVEVGLAAMVAGGLSGVCWLGAIGAYVWSFPTATADFVEQEGG